MRIALASLARKFALFSSLNFLYFFVQFGQSIYITRILGPEQFGLWAICLSTISITSIFFSFRTNEPFSRYLTDLRLAKNKNKSKEINLFRAVFLLEFILRTLCYGFIWIITLFVSSFLFKTHNAMGVAVLRIYGLIVVFDIFWEVWFAVLREEDKIQRFALAQFCVSLLIFGATVGFHNTQGLTLDSLAMIYTLVKGLVFIYLAIYFFFYFKKVYRVSFFSLFGQWSNLDRADVKPFLIFASYAYVNSTLVDIIKHIDILILNHFVAIREVGIYKLAKSLFSYIVQLGTFLAKILYQNFNELIFDKKNIFILWRYLKVILFSWGSLILLGAGLCWRFLDEFIIYFYGDDFQDTYQLFMLLGIGMFFALILLPFRNLIYTLKKFKILLFINTLLASIYLTCIFLLASFYGIKAISVLQGLYFFASNLFITIVSFVHIKKMTIAYGKSHFSK